MTPNAAIEVSASLMEGLRDVGISPTQVDVTLARLADGGYQLRIASDEALAAGLRTWSDVRGSQPPKRPDWVSTQWAAIAPGQTLRVEVTPSAIGTGLAPGEVALHRRDGSITSGFATPGLAPALAAIVRRPDYGAPVDLATTAEPDLRRQLLQRPPPVQPGPDIPNPDPAPKAWDAWKTDVGRQWRDASVGAVAARYGLADDPTATATLTEAYEVVRDHVAPFVVQVASAMLGQFKADVAATPGRQFVFLGRDGDALALAVQELDPDFFAEHCRQVTVSRKLVMLAVAFEQQGLTDPAKGWMIPQDLRVAPGEMPFAPTAEDIATVAARLPRYFESQGIELRNPDRPITLVDSSFKGTLQVMLSSIDEHTHYDSALIWHGKHPDDPHTGVKVGYASDFQPGYDKALDPKYETIVYEYLMRGPLSSPFIFDEHGRPLQRPESEVSPFGKPGMEVICDDRYRPPAIRDAVLALNREAVRDYARHIATNDDPGPELLAGFVDYRRLADTWARLEMDHPTGVPDRLTIFLDSFVRGGRNRNDRAGS